MQRFRVKFGFRHGDRKSSDEDDGMAVYDSDSDAESVEYLWQPSPRPHRMERYFKVGGGHWRVRASQLLLVFSKDCRSCYY